MKNPFQTTTVVIMLWAQMTLLSLAGERKIALHEYLNQSRSQEWVTYPFTAARGECRVESVTLAGPDGPMPVQLSAVEFWPDSKYIKSAQLSFIVAGLKPLTTNQYIVGFGSTPAPKVASDLTINSAADHVELATSLCNARLLLGEKSFDPPVPAKDVPGPMPGQSRLTGDAPVKAFSAKLTDSGPVFARVVITYTFADGNVVSLAGTLIAGDNALRWDIASQEDRPDVGVEFRLPPVPGVKDVVSLQGYGQWSRANRTVPMKPGSEPFTWLSPNTSIANIFPDCSWAVKLVGDGGKELRVLSRDPGAWADPVAPWTYGGFKTWSLDMIPQSWENWKRKRLPLSYAPDGTVTLRASFAKGARHWSVAHGAPKVGDNLNRIKDMVLDWPSKGPARPHLFVSKAERSPESLARIAGTLRSYLALFGYFDVMRGAIKVAGDFDAAIDSVSAADRALFRAQFAYLAYLMADPMCWSAERGYHSGNPNMSCSYILSLGVLACAIPDHPMAKEWAAYATAWEDKWLTDEVGSNGEWLPEGGHYSYVSLEPLLSYAIAAQRAGFHDFTNDPRLKKLVTFFAKYNPPRDPMRHGTRNLPTYGRGALGDQLCVFGMAARMTAGKDDAFSRSMQWMWSESDYTTRLGDSRMGGFESFYLDKNLPAAAPAWKSEMFPALGALFRHNYATTNESYLSILSNVDSQRNLDIWTPGIGGIAQWFALGKPISASFSFNMGYRERHELLRDGVRLARNWGAPGDPKTPFGHYTEVRDAAFATSPSADYVRSTIVNTTVDDRDWFPDNLPAYPKVTPARGTNLVWTRQLLFVKDPAPTGVAWLALRDTVRGGQPTAWQFWTYSEKIGTPDQVANAPAPGQTNAPARELPLSDRYTALGQFGVDVEYFIAGPAKTPRHTLRYGGAWVGNRVADYQDLLHLQLPGDGDYFVAVFPRPRAEAAPTFTALGDGKVIKAQSASGTDYVFLSAEPFTFKEGDIAFEGTAGAIQLRGKRAILTLGAAGRIAAHGKTLQSAGPVTKD